MFDNASRSLWLEQQLWPTLREKIPSLQRLPKEALVQVGYPASGARGRSEKIKPCEVNYNWHGNPNEKVFIAIHPIYFEGKDKKEAAFNTAKALTFGALKQVDGARWGAARFGLTKRDDGSIEADVNATSILNKVLEECGELPDGYGVAFPVRQVQRSRLRLYTCMDGSKVSDGTRCVHPKIRAASDTLQVGCVECGNQYKLA